MSESILNENLIATFEQSLRQTRNAQNRLMVRLREVETEADRLRQEIEALENSAEKTEAAIYSILATMGSKNARKPSDNNRQENYDIPSELRREEQYNLDRDEYHSSNRRNNDYSQNKDYRDDPPITYINQRSDRNQYSNNRNNHYDNYSNQQQQHRSVPQVGQNIEPISQRFSDRTITQACTLLLRESGKPLHVNELYNFLVAGGFEFKGNNPTISIAVSLNRNRRFKKVSPGTFDLVMRDASQAAS